MPMRTLARPSFADLMVMVVDDVLGIRLTMFNILKALGVKNVEMAIDGTDCLERLDKLGHIDIDLFFIDWQMEPMHGLDLVKKIRTGQNMYCPIIMFTGHCNMDLVEAARDVGVNFIMAKPIVPKIVARRIAAAMEQPKQFIRSRGYFGPDRRRDGERRKIPRSGLPNIMNVYTGPERRHSIPLKFYPVRDKIILEG